MGSGRLKERKFISRLRNNERIHQQKQRNGLNKKVILTGLVMPGGRNRKEGGSCRRGWQAVLQEAGKVSREEEPCSWRRGRRARPKLMGGAYWSPAPKAWLPPGGPQPASLEWQVLWPKGNLRPAREQTTCFSH